MNRVAGVDEQHVGMFAADSFDKRGDFGEAAVIGFVGVVIDRVDVAVKVGGAEDRDLDSIGGKASRNEYERKQDDDGCRGKDRVFFFIAC